MATKKIITNEQALRNLLKNLQHPFEAALLRERLLKISEVTRKDIKANPEQYNTPLCNADMFLAVCDRIDEHLKFD